MPVPSRAWTPEQIPISRHVPHASGEIYLDGVHVGDTIQCCHCQHHFVSVKGSGQIRGRCTRCQAMTCGAAACDPCRPWEREAERVEAAARRILLP